MIDDDPLVRKLVAATLEPDGTEVDEAESVPAGLEALSASHPDLVVLDIDMPAMDGWEGLERIRSSSDVPVVMLTSHTAEEEKVRALQLGADDYVEKPLAPGEFRARVAAVLRRSSRKATPGLAGLGEEIAGYRIEGALGHGGMGIVYRARHTKLDRVAAVKVLSPAYGSDPETVQRFQREWRMAAGLRHPNIVPIYDAGEADGRMYLAMQLVEGPDLATLAQDGIELDLLCDILGQVASALDAAHAAEIIHRDVKPANVLTEGRHAWLTDFGLAKAKSASRTLSQPGRVVGTAGYLAPEQIRGRQVGPAADIYGLAVTAFVSLTGGELPFEAESDIAQMWAHINEPPRRARDLRPGLPAAADDVLARGLAKDPAGRHGSAREFAEALRQALAR